MTAQSAAVMKRMRGTETVECSTEQISNQFSQMHELIARRAFEIFESNGGSPGHDLRGLVSRGIRVAPTGSSERNRVEWRVCCPGRGAGLWR